MINRQLELGFGTARATFTRSPHNRRARAQWWFDQMRQVVNRAFDWEPAPEPRPTQSWLQSAGGSPKPDGAQW